MDNDERVHALIHLGKPRWSAPDRRYIVKWMSRLGVEVKRLERNLVEMRRELWDGLRQLDEVGATDGSARMELLRIQTVELTAKLNSLAELPPSGVPCSSACPWYCAPAPEPAAGDAPA